MPSSWPQVAFDLVRHAVLLVTHARLDAVEVVHAHVLRLVHRGLRLRGALVHQVVRDLGLAVDHDSLAGQAEQVDADFTLDLSRSRSSRHIMPEPPADYP